MDDYFRPILQSGPARPSDALVCAGGWTWFTQVEVLRRTGAPEIISHVHLPANVRKALTEPRPRICDLNLASPRIMGILNITPDSFSDGGKHATVEAAVHGAETMGKADILDIGGESTRPGAAFIPRDTEIARTSPVISALRAAGIVQPISIDTRKMPVAHSALQAGANLVNDVSGFTYDDELAPFCARSGVPVCVMHAQGDPATMQHSPKYDNVLLDVFDFLADQIDRLEALGVQRNQIIADPGIGFGKTLEHNLELLSRLSLFHALGVPILLGASRKKFIGTIGQEDRAEARMPGSLAVALAALKHGTQIVRVHDVAETAQAIALWQAVVAGGRHG